jgi:cytochrome b
MNSPTLNAASATTPAPSRRVTDAPTRVFHWLFALCFTGAYLSAESERWRLVHVTLGYTFAGLLVFRLVWGLIGPRQARLSLMARKLSGLRTWFDGLLALVIAHIALIVLLSLLRRANLARPMLTGRIPGAGPDLAKRNHGVVAALVIAAVVGFWLVQAAA